MYQTGGTIKETLDAVSNQEFVLPAIQREFVWKPQQICRLFDSLMQGYPFGTFLYWRVSADESKKYTFYDFVRDFHERDNPHCPKLPPQTEPKPLTAVLDGQQRLTALNIGLRGSMAWKTANKWWNNPTAFPERFLFLNLLSTDNADDDELKYHFSFLTEEKASQENPDECWFKVSDIMSMTSGSARLKWLNERLPQDKTDEAFEVLDELYQVVHTKPLIAYYEEKSQELSKVLNIFIRMNSGGTILSYSDLLLSIAVAQWSSDARSEIHNLVDQLNSIGEGFAFSKDLVLKAGLMLSDIGNVGFKVENFNKPNMEKLEANWSRIKEALNLTVELISSFGFTGQTLRADSSILPIAYYLYQLSPGDNYISHSKYETDRQLIKEWFIRGLLKSSGIWGSGLDTLLTALREAVKEHGKERFPYDKIREVMTRRGKSLSFEDEEIEDLADMRFGDKRLFALLLLIFPFVNLGVNHHIDHIFPQSRFKTRKKLEGANVPEDKIDEFRDCVDRIGNLQLLVGDVNIQKRQKMPNEWLQEAFSNDVARKEYISRHLIGDVPENLSDFDVFYQERRNRLRDEISNLLVTTKNADTAVAE
jgi:uncharacterized protein DUF262/uncharacterized protein DUF1524